MLSPGPGSPTVFIGFLPAWRGIPLAAVGALQAAKQAADIAVHAAEAATMAAAGTPGAPAAYAAEQATKGSVLASMSSAITGAAAGADIHACVTPSPVPPHGPGVVITGSPTVTINNLTACRVGDTILEALGPPNMIAMGMPTVIIGDVGMGMGSFGQAGGVNSPVQALATRRPSAAEIQEIQDALDAGNRQRATDLAVRYYGINTANVPGGVRYDATVADYGVTSFNGRIRLGPTAFSSPEVLASTIAHETTHSNQAAAMRASDPTLTGWPNSTVDYDEAVAYDTEVRSAHQTGLESNPGEYEIARSRRETHRGNLSADDQTDYGNGGYPP
jgi:uncharacterized Zn-binding protein involved in type VI secretion